MRLINTALISTPANWPKVWLMALTGFIGLYLVTGFFNKQTEVE